MPTTKITKKTSPAVLVLKPPWVLSEPDSQFKFIEGTKIFDTLKLYKYTVQQRLKFIHW